MKDFMVIARVDGADYLSKVQAETNAGAEHKVLDLGVCGKHDYGVQYCTSYDAEAMKTDTFIGSALAALPIGFNALSELIKQNNERILAKDKAEADVERIQKQMQELEKQMTELKNQMAEAQATLYK